MPDTGLGRAVLERFASYLDLCSIAGLIRFSNMLYAVCDATKSINIDASSNIPSNAWGGVVEEFRERRQDAEQVCTARKFHSSTGARPQNRQRNRLTRKHVDRFKSVSNHSFSTEKWQKGSSMRELVYT